MPHRDVDASTTRTIGAGLAVVAAIAAPIIALTSGAGGARADHRLGVASQPTEEATPQPTQPATQQWSTAIPADFPLADAMGTASDPAYVGHEPGEVVLTEVAVCNQVAWSADAAAVIGTLGAVWSDGVEGGEQRTIVTYATGTDAARALAAWRGAVESCPDQSTGRGDYIQPIELQPSAAGDDALAYMDQYGADGRPTGEANAYAAVRVGNALLLDKTYVGGGGSTAVGQDTIDLLDRRSARVVDAMCIYAVDACPA